MLKDDLYIILDMICNEAVALHKAQEYGKNYTLAYKNKQIQKHKNNLDVMKDKLVSIYSIMGGEF